MGVWNGEGTSTLYLHVSMGKLNNKKKQIAASAYEGVLVKIEKEDDEFEGKPTLKYKAFLKDTAKGETACITFNAETWYSVGFFSRLSKVKPGVPIVMGAVKSEKIDKLSFCWMKQEGQKIEKDEAFPIAKDVTVGRTTIKDWTDVINAADKAIAEYHDRVAHTEQASGEGDLPF